MAKRKISNKTYWVSGVFFLVPAILCFIIYLSFRSQFPQKLSNQIQFTGSLASQDFKRTVLNDIESLKSLAERIEETKGGYFKYWKDDAQRLLDQNESLRFVEFINSEGIIKEVEPYLPNSAVKGFDIRKKPARYAVWKKKGNEHKVNLTNWIVLRQGGSSFLIDVPIHYDGEFKGTITGGMNFNNEFNRLSYYLDDYAIKIEDEEGTSFYDFNNFEGAQKDERFIFEKEINLDSNNECWNFKLTFANPDFFAESTITADYALLCGLVLSIAIGLLQFFNSISRRATLVALSANKELKRLNKELQDQTEIAKNAVMAKATFLSNMSHEIRTPLNAIVGISEFVEVDSNSNKNKYYNRLLRNNSQQLLSLIDDLLRIDKLESGYAEVNKVEFSPVSVVESITAFNRKSIQEKGLTFTTNINTLQKNYIYGDRIKFEQIISNVLSNAIKFTESGSICLNYSEHKKSDTLYIKLSIKDTGIGIPIGQRDRIFDYFTQLDSGIRKKHAGGGLGLAITARLVDLLKGSIRVESEENQGSEFFIELCFEGLHSKEELKLSSDLVEDLPPLEILIVDDNKLNIVILSQLLKKLGLRAESAQNGIEAVSKCSEKAYDLIFMDVHMPEMDGFEATRKIKNLHPKTLVLGLSADSTSISIVEGMESGMDSYLTKPIDKSKLIAILKEKFKTNSSSSASI